MPKEEGLYSSDAYHNLDQRTIRKPHPESRKIVKELMTVNDECFRGQGFTREQYAVLEHHLTVLLNIRDRELTKRFTSPYRHLCETAKYLDSTVLETSLSKLFACVEQLSSDKAHIVLGEFQQEAVQETMDAIVGEEGT